MEAALEIQGFTDPRLLTLNQVHGPAPSAASITAEMSGAFPRAGNRALEVVSTVVAVGVGAFMGVAASTAAVADIGDHTCVRLLFLRGFQDGGQYHVAEHFDSSTT
jgi:hypothetical protein